MKKKQRTVCKYCFCMFFAVIVMGACGSSGNSTAIYPLTPALIESIGGPNNLTQLSFYVSKEVKLIPYEDDALTPNVVVIESGVVRRLNQNQYESVFIGKKTPGAAVVNRTIEKARINYRILGVRFEDIQFSTIGFAAALTNPNSRFYIQFDNDEDPSIKYTSHDYHVTYKPEDQRPYLLVKVAKNTLDNGKVRKAPGVKSY